MNYMIDFHGVLNDQTVLFKNLTECILSNPQNKIYVCTGLRMNDALSKLKALGYEKDRHYTEVISLTDYFEATLPEDEINYDIRHNISVDETLWWSSKNIFCEKYNIAAVFDDRMEFLLYMSENIIKFHIRTDKKESIEEDTDV